MNKSKDDKKNKTHRKVVDRKNICIKGRTHVTGYQILIYGFLYRTVTRKTGLGILEHIQ